MRELAEWGNFYAIVGSAAGALIGLQFVALALIAQRPPIRSSEAGAAFATPTIVHFSAALFFAALLRAPWPTLTPAMALLGFSGFIGIAYALIVARRMKRQPVYKPAFEDWLFHVVLPLAVYAVLALSPFTAPSCARGTLFGVGGSVLLLLFVGVHNSWDAVAYHVFVVWGKQDNEKSGDEL